MSDQTHFGAWLRQRRKEYGYTQEELAELAGCSPATIRKIEAGERRPSPQVAELLADSLEVLPQERATILQLARVDTSRPIATGPLAPTPQTATLLSKVAISPLPKQEPETRNSKLNTQNSTTNLPILPTPSVGSSQMIDNVRDRLLRDDVRLLTLTGPPGIGKTRLSVEVASSVKTNFPGGIYFVPLAPVSDPNLVITTTAETLGVKESANEKLQVSLVNNLQNRRTLLLLDNFEHVIEASPVVVDLLASCPELKIIVTSREALHLRGERQFPVPTLELPDTAQLLDLNALQAYPAIALFLERAQAAKPGFTLTEENAEAIAAICARVEGLPLAIELAAARIKLLSPQEIVSRLSHSLPLLTGGPRDLPARQQTLRAAIEWSYNLLTEVEQQLFARLGVFKGGCTLSAAEAICGGLDTRDSALQIQNPKSKIQNPSEGIESLLDKNLLRQEGGADGEPRLTMLETIREYALECLESREETEDINRYHAEYYLALLRTLEPESRGGEQGVWLKRLEVEHDNFRAAMAWAIESGEALLALQLVGELWRFWYMRSHLTEGRKWLAAALAMPGNAPRTLDRVKALNGAGNLAYTQGDYNMARSLHEESISISYDLDDHQAVAATLNNLGLVARAHAKYDEALAFFGEALVMNLDLDNRNWQGINLNNLGTVYYYLGDYVESRSYQEESLALFSDIGNEWGIAMVLSDLGTIANDEGDYESAKSYFEKGLALQTDMGDRRGAASTMSTIAMAAWLQGDYPHAAQMFEQSLELFRNLGDRRGIADALNGLGHVACCYADFYTARNLYSESMKIREELNYKYEIAASRHNIGYVALRVGDYDEAIELIRRSVEEFREVGDKWAISYSLNNLARTLIARDECALARELLDESLAICKEINSKRNMTYVLGGLGLVEMCDENYAKAERRFKEKLALASELDAKWDIARGLLELSWTAIRCSQIERAVTLLAASETVRQAIGAIWEPTILPDYNRAITEAQAQLGKEAFQAAWKDGQAMGIEQAVAYGVDQ